MDHIPESGHRAMESMLKIWPTITTHLEVVPARTARLRHPRHLEVHPVHQATHKIHYLNILESFEITSDIFKSALIDNSSATHHS